MLVHFSGYSTELQSRNVWLFYRREPRWYIFFKTLSPSLLFPSPLVSQRSELKPRDLLLPRPFVSQHLETRGESNTIRADVSRHGVSIYRSKTFRSPMVSNSIHAKHNCRFRLAIVDNCGLTSKVIYFPDKHAVVFRSKAVINKKIGTHLSDRPAAATKLWMAEVGSQLR